MASDDEKKLESIDLVDWILGTSKQIAVTDNGNGTVTLSLDAPSSTVGIGGSYNETFAAAGESAKIADFECAPKDQIDNFTKVALSAALVNSTAGVTTTATLYAYTGAYTVLGTISVTGTTWDTKKSDYIAIPTGTLFFSITVSVDAASTGYVRGPVLYFR